MESESSVHTDQGWQARQAYAMAVFCLLAGLAMGYFLRGSQSPDSKASAASERTSAHGASAAVTQTPAMPSMEQMRQMADAKAGPLLEQLKHDPRNAGLLVQVGNIYKATHQFKQAAEYYGQSLKIEPNNAVRVEMASCLHYTGDANGALEQLTLVLKSEPHNINALFNQGMIRWQAQHDAAGALASWEALLRTNPDLDAEKRAQVEHLMAEIQQPKAHN
jgi:cytochrome c-type biogenesis protein CcmH/NrfG